LDVLYYIKTRNNCLQQMLGNLFIDNPLVAYDTILAYAGNDFMCIKLVADTISAVWGDTRSGKLNIWF